MDVVDNSILWTRTVNYRIRLVRLFSFFVKCSMGMLWQGKQVFISSVDIKTFSKYLNLDDTFKFIY